MSALQCEMRALFEDRPSNRALAEALQRICQRIGALYAVVHTRFGGERALRGMVRRREPVLFRRPGHHQPGAVGIGLDRTSALRPPQGWPGRPAARDGRHVRPGCEPSGGAAIVLPPCDKARVLQIMAQLEGILGYVSLLFDQGSGSNQNRTAERKQLKQTDDADHPVRLATRCCPNSKPATDSNWRPSASCTRTASRSVR